MAPGFYEPQSRRSLGSDWSRPGSNVRTTVGLPSGLTVLKPGVSGLPRLPKVTLTLRKTKADSAVNRLSEILRETIAEQTVKG